MQAQNYWIHTHQGTYYSPMPLIRPRDTRNLCTELSYTTQVAQVCFSDNRCVIDLALDLVTGKRSHISLCAIISKRVLSIPSEPSQGYVYTMNFTKPHAHQVSLGVWIWTLSRSALIMGGCWDGLVSDPESYGPETRSQYDSHMWMFYVLRVTPRQVTHYYCSIEQ